MAVLVSIICLFFILITWEALFIPLTYAFVLSLFVLPICKTLEKRTPRWLAILLTLFSMSFLMFGIIYLVASNLADFSNDLPKIEERLIIIIAQLQTVLEKYLHIKSGKAITFITDNTSSIMEQGSMILNSLITSTTSLITNLVLIPLYMFFMLYYRNMAKNFIYMIIADQHIQRYLIIEKRIQRVTYKYFTGLATVTLIIAILNVTGLMLIGIDHALFFGTFCAMLTVIPYIGIIIGSMVPAIYALAMTDSIFYPIAILAWFKIVQLLEGNFITPNITGSSVSLNPLVSMLVLLIGGYTWGISGMILSIPITAMLKVILDNVPNLVPLGYILGPPNNAVQISLIRRLRNILSIKK